MFKIFVWFLIFLFSGLNLVYSNNDNDNSENPPSNPLLIYDPDSGYSCPSPMTPEECQRRINEDRANNPYKWIKELFITNDNIQIDYKTQKKYKPAWYEYLAWYNNSYDSIVYAFKNKNWELIYFNNDGTYCNTYTGTCWKFPSAIWDRPLESNSTNIFKSNKYIFFLTLNSWYRYLFIYDIENNKSFNIDLNHYVKLKHNWREVYPLTNSNYNYDDVSFDVYNWVLNFYFYYTWVRTSQGEFRNKILNLKINTNNIDNSLFWDWYTTYHRICSNPIFNDYKWNIYDNKLNINISFFHSLLWTWDCKFYKRNVQFNYLESNFTEYVRDSNDISVWMWFLNTDDVTDVYWTYIKNRGKLNAWWIIYLSDSTALYNYWWSLFSLYFSDNDNNPTNWITLNRTVFWAWLLWIFSSMRLLSVEKDFDWVFYISYYRNWKVHTLQTNQIYDIENSNYQVLEDKYYLWTFNKIKVFLYKTSNFSFSDSISYPSFFVARSWDNLKFFLVNRSWSYYNYSILVSTDNVFINSRWPFWWYHFGWWNLNIGNNWFTDWWWQQDDNWSYIDSNIRDINKDKEQAKETYNKYFSDIPILGNIIWTFSLWFPENWNTNLKVPFINPEIQNWKAKVTYTVHQVELQPIDDKLHINALWDSDPLAKKFISFFLAFFYVMVKFWIILLWFFFIKILFSFVFSLQKLLFPAWFSNDNKGNIWVVWVFIWFVVFYFWVFAWFISILGFYTEFMVFVKNIIDLIFWFLASNFLDFELFKQIIHLVDISVIGLFVWYVWLLLALNYWKLN